MRLLLLLTILLVPVTAVAQADENTPCPAFEFLAPATVVNPGDSAIFFVKNLQNTPNVEYGWTSDAGKIETTKDPAVIKIVGTEKLQGEKIGVTVRILGLPEICKSQFSDFAVIATRPIGTPLFNGIGETPENDFRLMIDSTFITLDSDTESHAVFVSYGPEYKVNARHDLTRRHIKLRGYDPSRIRLEYRMHEAEIRTYVWVVPPGADEKGIYRDRVKSISPCPKITVTGPASVIRGSSPNQFTVTFDKEIDLSKMELVWTAKNGTIVSENGKQIVSISPLGEGELITATVAVIGPGSCKAVGSDTGIPYDPPQPILIEDNESPSATEIKMIVNSAVKSLEEEPYSTIYFVTYGNGFKVREFERAVLKAFGRSELSNRIFFVNGGNEDTLRTRVWVVPAGADAKRIN